MPNSRLPVSKITYDYWITSDGSVYHKNRNMTDPSSMILQLVVLRLKQAQSVKLKEENNRLTIELSLANGIHCYVLSSINTDADHLIWLMVLCLVYAQSITGSEVNQVLGKKAIVYLLDKPGAKLALPSLKTKQPMQVAHWALCLSLGINPPELTAVSVDDILEAVVQVNEKRPKLKALLEHKAR